MLTSEEIKTMSPVDRSTNGWLKEVAYQLALMNERAAKPEIPAIPKKRA